MQTEACFACGSVYFVESAFPEALRILHLSLPMRNRFVRKRFFVPIFFLTYTRLFTYIHGFLFLDFSEKVERRYEIM